MAKLLPPPSRNPDITSSEWTMYFNQFKQAETQTDGVDAVGNPPTGDEFNALVAVVNALIDKLQAAGLME